MALVLDAFVDKNHDANISIEMDQWSAQLVITHMIIINNKFCQEKPSNESQILLHWTGHELTCLSHFLALELLLAACF